jgi:BON domain
MSFEFKGLLFARAAFGTVFRTSRLLGASKYEGKEVSMKKTLFGLLLLLATATLAQQQGQRPPTSPPQSTPPTFPEDRAPRQQIPPDQEAPPQALSTPEVQQQIQQGLNSEPMLRNSNVGVHVDENSVILTGTVASEEQHDLALRIAQSYAGDRKIVDKIKLTQLT